jgi:hypothetical protein
MNYRAPKTDALALRALKNGSIPLPSPSTLSDAGLLLNERQIPRLSAGTSGTRAWQIVDGLTRIETTQPKETYYGQAFV